MQCIFLAILISLPFSVAGIFFSKELLGLMGGDEWSLTRGYRYTQWMLGGNGIIVLLFVINAIFRGAGDAAIAMRVLWIANGLNIILDPFAYFRMGPHSCFRDRRCCHGYQYWPVHRSGYSNLGVGQGR